MKNYELLYIVSNQYTESELITIREKVNGLLTKYDATLGFTELLGKKKLSYPINKVNHGYYVVAEFELEDGSVLTKITNDLRLDKEVLRAQIIAKPKITPEEIERQNKQRAKQAEAAAKSEEEASDKPVRSKKMETKSSDDSKQESSAKKPVDMKKLDEKLDEILQDDTII